MSATTKQRRCRAHSEGRYRCDRTTGHAGDHHYSWTPLHPIACECGFTGTPQTDQRKAADLLRQHQRSTACALSPNYLTPEQRHRKQTARAIATVRDRSHLDDSVRSGERCSTVGCRRRASKTRTTGLCEDHHQELVHDTESPMELTGGRWVTRRGIRVWQPNTTTSGTAA